MVRSQNFQKGIFKSQIAFVCGGSQGIGKETAKEFIRQGGSVCILARNEQTLEKAKNELSSLIKDQDQFVETITGDSTNHGQIEPLIVAFIEKHGVPDYLINAVGYAQPDYVQNLQLKDFKNRMEINYFGQVIPTLIFLPYFIREQKGHISFISSMLGFMGIIGYASYVPTKFAIVGFAEALRHELKPNNITVSILYPPDTDTPGFEQENKTKPEETAILSETANLFTPEKVAVKYLNGIKKGKFYILFGEGLWIWRIFRVFPWFVHMFIDNDLKKARKKLRKD